MNRHEECQGIQSQILTNLVNHDYINVERIEITKSHSSRR